MTNDITSTDNNPSNELSKNAQAIARMKEHITSSNFSTEDLRLLRTRVHNAMIMYFEDEEFRKQSQLLLAFMSNEIRSASAIERLSDIVIPTIE